MQKVLHLFNQLQESLNHNSKDSSIAAQLEQSIASISSYQLDIEVYTRIMLSIYDLSNHHNLICTPDKQSDYASLSVHQLSLRLKIQAVKMICILLDKFDSEGQNNQIASFFSDYTDVQLEALEIMILSIRLCLDSPKNSAFTNFQTIYQCQVYCERLYKKLSQWEKTNSRINSNKRALMIINSMDTMRINVDSASFNMRQFILKLKEWELHYSNYSSARIIGDIQKQALQNSNQYISCITTEICLKLLRKGEKTVQIVSQLINYLPENYQMIINSIINENRIPQQALSVFGEDYQLYWQIMSQGMENISEQYLENMVEQMYENKNSTIFDIVILTNQPTILKIWMAYANKKINKPSNLIKSYECFFAIVEIFLSKNNEANKSIDIKKEAEIIDLSRQLCLNILRENKNTSIPIQEVAKYINKLLIQMVANCSSNYKLIDELFENLYLVATKYGLTVISKNLSSLQLYFQMMHQIQKQETFKKFMKHNSHDKSSINMLLKTSYEILKGDMSKIDENSLELVKNRPEFALLLLEKSQKILLLLDLEMSEFKNFGNCFEIYLSMFKQFENQQIVMKIATHAERYLITTNYTDIQIHFETLQVLQQIIYDKIEHQSDIFCRLYLYFYCFYHNSEKTRQYEYGQAFNKFSKLIKMLSQTIIQQQAIEIMKIYICKSCQKYKKNKMETSSKKKQLEAGQIMFIKILFDTIMNYSLHDKMQPEEIAGLDLIKFSMFEIYCLHSRDSELQNFLSQNNDPKLHKLCLNSVFLPKHIKRMILRQLFKTNLADRTYPYFTLEDIKDLIELTDAPYEIRIYITAAIDIFGIKAKKYLEILASENEKIASILISLDNSIMQ